MKKILKDSFFTKEQKAVKYFFKYFSISPKKKSQKYMFFTVTRNVLDL